MRVSIQDREALRRFRPADIQAYLRSCGWPAAADFPLRVSEVMHALEVIENRSQEEMFKDIAASFADIVRVRAAPTEENDGTLPLNFGVEFIKEARNMVLAAACARIAARP